MLATDKPTFEQAMEVLYGAFTIGRSNFENKLDSYFDYLSDVPLSKVLKALDDAVRTLDTFPSINKLRNLCNAKDGRFDCAECKRIDRQQHITELAQQYYEQCNRDIPWTLERIYLHTQTSFATDPEVRLWAKQGIAELEGWPLTPKREQTREERLEMVATLAAKMSTREMMQCGAIG